MRNLALFLVQMLLASALNAQVTLVPFGSSWKYLDDGSDQGTAWRSPSFNDASWKTGNGKFGYGIPDANTVINYGPDANNKYVTTYFRKTIVIVNPDSYSSFTIRINRDDGLKMYVDGVEYHNSNMSAGDVSHTTLATAEASDNGAGVLTFDLAPPAGRKYDSPTVTFIVAIEVHQAGVNSPDMAFDFEVIGNPLTPTPLDQTPPLVQSINRQSPSTQTTDATSVTFRTTFSEQVSGVDATDFSTTTVSGNVSGTITAVTPVGSNGTTYDVTVSSITGTGVLRLDLKSSGTGIQDAAGNQISGGFTGGQSYTFEASTPPPVVGYGFASVTPLTTLTVSDDTQHKPQGKVWTHDGKWWCAISVSGTRIYRLDGTSWTEILKISNSGGRADTWAVGDLVHILMHRGTSTSYLATVQYDAATKTYKPWSQRPNNTAITFPTGTKTATLTVDGAGRLWVASDASSDVRVWYSDAPYTSWSAPIIIASNLQNDDICAITKLHGKIGVFWSNHNTGLFGFKTHTDGAAPGEWSNDEGPAHQSAIPGVPRMADDHMSLVPASDGTLFVAIKTSYNTAGRVQLGLMVRRPSGIWDPLHPVIINDGSNEGTQPIVILNEAMGKIKVVYTTITNGGHIAYRESSISNISFGEQKTLISTDGLVYNFATSTHQTYNPEVVILATKVTVSPRQLVSVLASDIAGPTVLTSSEAASILPGTSKVPGELAEQNQMPGSLKLHPNPFSGFATLSFTLTEAGKYTISLYDNRGAKLSLLKQGWAEAGMLNTLNVNGVTVPKGLYFVSLQTDKGIQTIKVIVKN